MLNRRGQNTAEYAILIALVIAAAVAMQTYVKRSVQGGVKYTVDRLKSGSGATATGQYEPYYLQQKTKTTQQGFTDYENTQQGGAVYRVIGEGDAHTTSRTGNQTIASNVNAD